MRVLVVDDDVPINRLLTITFEKDGHEVVAVDTGEAGIEVAASWTPDLVLLDLGLPDMHGRDVLKKIRETSDVPVIIVSAFGEVIDRVVGLELGSDDYIVKPFNLSEIVARARAVTRRARPSSEGPKTRLLQRQDLTMDVDEHRVTRGAELLDLTKREFQLLRALMEQHGGLVTRSDIARSIWGVSARQASRSMDVCVSALRRKLGDEPKQPQYIETVRGVGFRLLEREHPARLRIV